MIGPFDYRYVLLLFLMFVLGWQCHRFYDRIESRSQEVADTPEQVKDTALFPETQESLLSDEEITVDSTYHVKSGDTFSSILEKNGVRFPLKTSLECEAFFDIKKIAVGQTFEIQQKSGQTNKIQYKPNSYQTLIINLTPEADVVSFSEVPITSVIEVITLNIDSTFWEACSEVGLGPKTIFSLAKLFEYHVDFATELRSGATLQAVIDGHYANDERVNVGEIHSVRLTNAGKEYAFFSYDEGDKPTMYDSKGRVTGRPFLRSPLEYIRITSNYGVKRKTGYHGGIDFGAPTGTPVRAVADGVVTWAKWNGNYGNHVKVKHKKYGAYETSYSHLSKIKVKKGQTVKQGTIIGLVGSTGRSTGPHLHYEMKIHGKRVHPLKQDLPYMEPISSAHKDAFNAKRDKLITAMDSLRIPEEGLE